MKSPTASAEHNDRLAWIASLRPVGRKGYPDDLIDAMRLDYTRTKSVEKTGALWGITRQSCWDILQRRRCTVSKKPPTEVVEYKGQRFVPDKDGYLRCTSFDSRKPGRLRLLHHIVWAEHHGPKPGTHILLFKDGNRLNCAIENLECVTRSEARRRGGPSENGWTKYRKIVAELEKPWLAALARNAPAAEIQKLRATIDAVPKPRRDEAKRAKILKAVWDTYTPEERAARIAKGVAGRKKKNRKSLGRHISISQTLNHVARLAQAA